MGLHTGSEEKLKRISLTLPTTLYEELDSIKQKKNTSTVEVIRQAIHFWIEHQVAEKMAEGYRLENEENQALMKQFEHVDKEIW
ncbi:MAG: ribbon-helix-helix protein, CopG family [Candidatus Marinimicrobia bacterium]|nr:ribbon-helix-helix protein, CopG family [Candidatus Neomarinimicrobiota bacterium]